jgi:predicted dehydrogenase/threonine dehydrogenase-like Zn-dependent dehydrogenase
MKQVVRRVCDRRGRVLVAELPAPALGPREVLVSLRYSAISPGTERATLAKTLPELVRQSLGDRWTRQAAASVLMHEGLSGIGGRLHDELVALRPIGYSGAGVVLEVGERVSAPLAGARVAVSAWGHAELVAASVNQCVEVPDGVPLADASFGQLGAIALQAVRRAAIEVGHTVAVVGLGLLGQLVAQIARATGASCLGIEPRGPRRELALQLGLADAVDPSGTDPVDWVRWRTGGTGADRVVLCATGRDPALVNQAMRMCRKHGRLTLLGIVPLELERMPFFNGELDVVFSRAAGPGAMEEDWLRGDSYPPDLVRWDARANLAAFLDLLAGGRVAVAPLVGATFGVSDAQSAFDVLASGDLVAALLSYPESEGSPARRVALAPAALRHPRGEQVGVGVIGCGRFAGGVLLPRLARSRHARLLAIAAKTGVHAAPMAKRYGIPRITTDVADLLADPEIDAVVVATRHELHGALALEAIAAGKHALIEKPLALDAGTAVEIAGGACARGLHVVVGHNRRHAPLVRRLLAERSPEAGPAMSQYTVSIAPLPAGHWTLDPEQGGRLLGEADHFFDLLALFAGARARSVTATSMISAAGELHRSTNFSVLIAYADGSTGTLLYTDRGGRAHHRERLEVFTGGRVLRLVDFRRAELIAKRRRRLLARPGLGHAEEIENFCGVILGRCAPQADVEDGLEATLTAQAAWRSLRESRTVTLDELTAPGAAQPHGVRE